jgi:Ca2+-binding RTX toxin-like protein
MFSPHPSHAVPAVLAALAVGGLGTAAAQAQPAPAKHIDVKVRADTLLVRGSAQDDNLVLRLRAGRPDVLEIDAGGNGSADASVQRDRFDRILVDARGGGDAVQIDETNGVFTDTETTTIDGGRGNDKLLGGSGAERLVGGRGDDFADGGRGNDSAFLGAGNDTFNWDPGEGSDRVEGQAGRDTMTFVGANVPEAFDVSANGHRVRFVRNVGNITMDLAGVERIDTQALGGADTFAQHDLRGTDLVEDNVDLAGTPGGTASDRELDSVIVSGTARRDGVSVSGSATAAAVRGVPAAVRVMHPDATDGLRVEALAGNDVVEASQLTAGVLRYSASGGDGNDVLIGSAGDDTLQGDNGNDVLVGGLGIDALDGGPGANIVVQ